MDVQGYESTLTSPEPPMSGEELMGAGSKSLAGKHPFYTLMTLPLRNGLGIRHWAELKFLHILGILGNYFYCNTPSLHRSCKQILQMPRHLSIH